MGDENEGQTARRRTLALLGLMFLALPAAAATPAPGERSVLIVEAGDPSRPSYITLMGAFRETLRDAVATPVALYAENLDLGRFGSPDYLGQLRAWYRTKYRDRRLDAIVALGPEVLGPLQAWRAELWPDVPLVFVADPRTLAQVGQPAGATGITFEIDVVGSIQAALALLPDTQRVALVGGAPAGDLYTRAFAAELRRAYGDRLAWIDLMGLPMADLTRRIAALPEHTIVFYGTIARDGAGQAWVPQEALATFAPHANRPIFSISASYLGHGIVGGSLLSFEVIGRETARVVAQVLGGESPASIPVRAVAANVLQFDWRELQRFRLDERRLPPGSQIVNRPPSLWEQHWRVVLVTLGVLVAQGVAIVGLLVEQRRRRRAETDLHRLSGRLLTAQEEERRRIARDLHDDVGQRLALLAIEAEQLPTRPPRSPDGLGDRARDLAAKAQGLASDIHRIAYELHPARLEHLGFAAAVRRFGEELQERHPLAVDVVETDWPGDVPLAVALCLYRVTQEALQNVVRHSGAREARVALAGHRDRLTVTVSDAGAGFETGTRREDHGLGLAGMRERLRLVGGTLTIDTSPGRGTRIQARVPRGALSAASLGAEPGTDHAEASRPAG